MVRIKMNAQSADETIYKSTVCHTLIAAPTLYVIKSCAIMTERIMSGSTERTFGIIIKDATVFLPCIGGVVRTWRIASKS